MNSRALLLLLILLVPERMFSQISAGAVQQAAGATQDTAAAKDDELLALGRRISALFAQRKYVEALTLAQNGVERGERLYGKDDLRLAPFLTNLAILSLVNSKPDEAEPLFKRAIAIYEQKAGQNDPRMSVALNSYGWLQFRKKDYGRAEALFKRSVAIQETTYGTDNVEVAPHLAMLADFYQARGNYSKADSLYSRAVSIMEKTQGIDGKLLLGTLERRLCLQIHFSKTKEASQVLEHLYKMKVPFKGDAPAAGQPKKEDASLGLEKLAGDKETLLYNFVGMLEGKLISKPLPEYPAKAQSARLSGTVVTRIVVDEEGKVIAATPMCAHPLLMEAVQKAALNARFTPSLQDGRPVKVSGYIVYQFGFDKSPVGPSSPVIR